jgi:hypothetical protein
MIGIKIKRQVFVSLCHAIVKSKTISPTILSRN